MIKIKELTVRNFMSVGNQTQGVNFAQEKLNTGPRRKLRSGRRR